MYKTRDAVGKLFKMSDNRMATFPQQLSMFPSRPTIADCLLQQKEVIVSRASRARLGKLLVAFAFAILLGAGSLLADDISPISFVNSLVDDFSRIHSMRKKSSNEAAAAGGDLAQMATGCIHNSTTLALELRSQAARYADINLSGRFSELGPYISLLWQHEAQLNDEFVVVCQKLLAASNPLSETRIAQGQFSQISAQSEYVDEMVFRSIMPMAIDSLISDKPDANGRRILLNITGQDPERLRSKIENEFGDDMQGKSPGYLVRSMGLLKGWLENKGFRATDDK